MKVKSSVTSLVASLALAGSVVALADIGGGSGKPMTPYGADETIDEARVEKVRREANTLRSVEEVPVNGTNASKTGYKVGVVCASGPKFTGTPQFRFHGIDPAGVVRDIEFAEVEAFQLIATAADSVTISVTQFPAITPRELLKLRPTYTALATAWKKLVMLKMTSSCDGGELTLAGTDWDTETKYNVLFRLRDLRPNVTVELKSTARRGATYWWAIPSVTADKAYPYRQVMKK
jgi:hypothetical protein